jgi:hypothetical protein
LKIQQRVWAASGGQCGKYLAAARDPPHGRPTTRPGTTLRNSITIRKASDEAEAEPGLFEVDTVTHCGPALKRELARTVNLTDVLTGWMSAIATRKNARTHSSPPWTPPSKRSPA